ncbi:MAG: response regulator [Nitrospirota bacterium]|nr:response regulator [Nitrospirota bacterium]
MKRVLIAEDEYITALWIKNVIKELGHEVVALVDTGEMAVKQALELRPDISFLDINMEQRNSGIDACRSIKKLCPSIKIYFLSAYPGNAFSEELAGIQYDGYIDKMDFADNVGRLLDSD